MQGWCRNWPSWGRALLTSPVRNTLFALAIALVGVIAATAYGQIRLNRWNRPFYDALSNHQLDKFLVQLGVFAVIAGVLLILNVAQKWLGEMSKLKLREGLVDDLIDHWMMPRRGFRLEHAGFIGVNPDQRIREVFEKDLGQTALIHIGRSPVQKPFFSKVLHVVQDPEARRLPRMGSVAERPAVMAV